MTEKYILVSDDEYCYTLDTSDENYKTLEDFEKQEFENAKHDGIDIKDYEDAILQSASDKYWDWVYTNHLEADTANDIMNALVDENEQLKQFKEKVFALIDEKIKHYEHKPFSAPVSNPANPNYDHDVDMLARLSELQELKMEFKE